MRKSKQLAILLRWSFLILRYDYYFHFIIINRAGSTLFELCIRERIKRHWRRQRRGDVKTTNVFIHNIQMI